MTLKTQLGRVKTSSADCCESDNQKGQIVLFDCCSAEIKEGLTLYKLHAICFWSKEAVKE